MSTVGDGGFAPVHPLAYVVLELRIPFSPRLASQSSVEELVRDLVELPVLREEARHTLASTDDGGVEVRPVNGWRLSDLESTRSLIVTPTALIYESTRYAGFDRFCADLDRWLGSVEKIGAPVGYDRLGLRYVNEVRPVHRHAEFADWAGIMSPNYINSLLDAQQAVRTACLAPSDPTVPPSASGQEAQDVSEESPTNCTLVNTQTALSFRLPDNTGMTLKLGNRDGEGVIGNAPLKRYQLPEPGPFFVVDFDGFWPATGTDIRPFDRHEILARVAQVHAPVKSAFGWATTSDYRKEAGVIND